MEASISQLEGIFVREPGQVMRGFHAKDDKKLSLGQMKWDQHIIAHEVSQKSFALD